MAANTVPIPVHIEIADTAVSPRTDVPPVQVSASQQPPMQPIVVKGDGNIRDQSIDPANVTVRRTRSNSVVVRRPTLDARTSSSRPWAILFALLVPWVSVYITRGCGLQMFFNILLLIFTLGIGSFFHALYLALSPRNYAHPGFTNPRRRLSESYEAEPSEREQEN